LRLALSDAKEIGAHKDFLITIRSEQSEKLAKKYFSSRVVNSPDAARLRQLTNQSMTYIATIMSPSLENSCGHRQLKSILKTITRIRALIGLIKI